MLSDLVPSEGPLSGGQKVVSSLCPHMWGWEEREGEREKKLSGVSYEGTNTHDLI